MRSTLPFEHIGSEGNSQITAQRLESWKRIARQLIRIQNNNKILTTATATIPTNQGGIYPHHGYDPNLIRSRIITMNTTRNIPATKHGDGITDEQYVLMNKRQMHPGIGHVIEDRILGTDLALVVKVVQMTMLGHVLAEDCAAWSDCLGPRSDPMGQRSGFSCPSLGILFWCTRGGSWGCGLLAIVVIVIVVPAAGRDAINHLLRVRSGDGISLVNEPPAVERFVNGVRCVRWS
mmetsp:Transcript_21920/g.47419  ORF Transcript_21920/g.47419 Transcript_21920/m.47419 type:complete len:234 (-) Transcript_21920:222-923(-)